MDKFIVFRFYSLCMLAGTAGFLLLGHIVKLVPNLFWGSIILRAALNLAALYLMMNYEDLKEYCWYFFASEAIAAGLGALA